MRVMTFNLRFENGRDGPNGWSFRREQVAGLILDHAPDVVGTQEGKWTQLLYLQDHLPGYDLHAPGRVIDDTCQYPTLFLGQKNCRVEKGGEFWLSKTPKEHRSKDWDSAFPRMLSCARLTLKSTGRTLWTAVTHLDHKGVKARVEQAKIIAGWVRSLNEPVILMGDFNETPASTVHEVLTAPEVGLLDTWQVLGLGEGRESYTHHGFEGIPGITRMDWILMSAHFSVKRAEIIRDHEEGRYPSDHFPYMVDAEI